MKRITLALLAALALVFPADAKYVFQDPVAVVVTTAATLLTSSTVHFAEICNTDTSKELRLGFTTAVTATTGRPLQAGTCLQASLNGAQNLYGIVAVGSLTAIVTKAKDIP